MCSVSIHHKKQKVCLLPSALLLVLVGFPHIYGGVNIGGPGGEKITPPGGVTYPGSCGPVITGNGVMHITIPGNSNYEKC